VDGCFSVSFPFSEWYHVVRRQMAPDFNAQDLSMFFHALGVMGHPLEAIGKRALLPFFDRMEGALFECASPSLPQNVVQVRN
jgi:hypothetical protein